MFLNFFVLIYSNIKFIKVNLWINFGLKLVVKKWFCIEFLFVRSKFDRVLDGRDEE